MNQSSKSIDSAKMALEIDKNYTKCYYRLAVEYQKVNKGYDAFVNAIVFQRMAGEG